MKVRTHWRHGFKITTLKTEEDIKHIKPIQISLIPDTSADDMTDDCVVSGLTARDDGPIPPFGTVPASVKHKTVKRPRNRPTP